MTFSFPVKIYMQKQIDQRSENRGICDIQVTRRDFQFSCLDFDLPLCLWQAFCPVTDLRVAFSQFTLKYFGAVMPLQWVAGECLIKLLPNKSGNCYVENYRNP